MLSMPKTIEASGLGTVLDYHEESLDSIDYHLADGRPSSPSLYAGVGAKALGLAGKPITREAMERILKGFDPRSGKKKLVQNAGSESRDTLGWDIPFSAPKTVSLAFAFADPVLRDEIQAALVEAAQKSVEFYESRLHVRVGRGGKRWEKIAGLAPMLFVHSSSRALDPSPHVHLVIPSAALRSDGSWATLDEAEVRKHTKAAGLVGQNHLAKRMQEFGFEIEPDPENDWSFRIKGVSDEACRHFSQGREKILAEAKRLGIEPSDSVALQRIANRVKNSKAEPPFQDLLDLWRIRGKEVGISPETIETIREDGMEIRTPEEAMAEEIHAALTEQQSYFSRADVFKEIARRTSAQGGLTMEEIEARTERILAQQETVFLSNSSKKNGKCFGPEDPIFSTKEMIRLEHGIVESFKKSQAQKVEVSDDEVAESIRKFEEGMTAKNREFDPEAPEVKMKDEQKDLVRLALQGGGQSIIVGDAGTGKTFSIAPAVHFFKERGWKTVGAAIAGRVADGLKEAGLDSTWTIDALLPAIERGQFKPDAKTVLFVDEAAMVGSRQIAALQKAFAEKGGRILFVGDQKQFQSISGGGGWFASLQEDFKGATTRLQDIVRQRSQWHIEAIRDFMNGRAKKALETFEKEGLLKTAPTKRKAVEQMAEDYLADSIGPDGKPISHDKKIAIADQWPDVDALNSAIRKGLIERGLVEERSHSVAVEVGRDKRSIKIGFDFSVGDRIRFFKNRSMTTEDGERIQVRNGHFGTIREIKPMRAGDFEMTVERTDGKVLKFRTGASFDEKGKEVQGYDWLRHSYAGTNYGLQGATVEETLLLGDETRASRHSAYVGSSRSKGKTTIYAAESKAGELARAMSRDMSKGWSLDFLSKDKINEILFGIEAKPEEGMGCGEGERNAPSPAQAPPPPPSTPRKPLLCPKGKGMGM